MTPHSICRIYTHAEDDLPSMIVLFIGFVRQITARRIEGTPNYQVNQVVIPRASVERHLVLTHVPYETRFAVPVYTKTRTDEGVVDREPVHVFLADSNEWVLNGDMKVLGKGWYSKQQARFTGTSHYLTRDGEIVEFTSVGNEPPSFPDTQKGAEVVYYLGSGQPPSSLMQCLRESDPSRRVSR